MQRYASSDLFCLSKQEKILLYKILANGSLYNIVTYLCSIGFNADTFVDENNIFSSVATRGNYSIDCIKLMNQHYKIRSRWYNY